ncbi:MAG: carbohydrate kinase [Planctomycetaceae bacterium]|nr:carbohydrate kinase [Planctomycetaceae bacterium]
MNPIVGIGELLWDVYPDGRKVAGGAPFNFAFHCHQLGHPAVIVSRVGNDDLGRELRERVRELGLSDEYIQTDRKLPTGTVQVTVDNAGQPSYRIVEKVAWDSIEWNNVLADVIRRAAALCHGTLGFRNKVSRQTILKAAGLKSRRGSNPGLVVFDVNIRGEKHGPGRRDWDAFEQSVVNSHWAKMNENEDGLIAMCIDHMMDDDPWPRTTEGMFKYLRHFTKLEDRLWIVTRGADGAELTSETIRHHESGVPAKVVDTVGAGDSFTAAMVCLHLEGRPLRECAQFAVHYAARVCEQPGGTPRIDRKEVERAVFGVK